MKTRTGFKHVIIRFAAVALAALMISSCARQGDTVDRVDDDDESAHVSMAAEDDSNDGNDSGDDSQDISVEDDITGGEGSSDDDPQNDADPNTEVPGDDGAGDEAENGGLTGDESIDGIDALEVGIGQNEFRLDQWLSYDQVKDLNADELATLRNSIYAYRGYIFKNEKYTDMFSRYDWYKPEHDDVEDLLSDRDKLNINLILKIEGKYGALYDVLSLEETPLQGFWQYGVPHVAAGYNRTYAFNKDRSVEFRENEMDGEERVRALYGSWHVLNGKLCVYFTTRDVIVGGELEPAMGSIGTEYEIIGGKLVSEDLEDPIIEMYELNFDQKLLEYGEDCFGVMMGGEEYYCLGERYY